MDDDSDASQQQQQPKKSSSSDESGMAATPSRSSSSRGAAKAPTPPAETDSLSRLENDIRAKIQGGPQATAPGAVSVRNTRERKNNEDSLSRFERDIEAKRAASNGRSAVRPGAVPEAALSTQSEEQDKAAKRNANSHHGRTTRPGAIAVSSKDDNLSRFERDIQAKQSANVGSSKSVSEAATPAVGNDSLTRLERDILSKQQAASGHSFASQPGVVPAPNMPRPKTDSLNRLEQDIVAKQSAGAVSRDSLAGGVDSLGRLDQDILSKQREVVASRPGAVPTPNVQRPKADSLGQLEQDIIAKQSTGSGCIGDVAGRSGGADSLGRLEQDILCKQQAARGRNVTAHTGAMTMGSGFRPNVDSLSRLEQDIVAKQRARGSAALSPGAVPSNRGVFDQLEQDILAKQGTPNSQADSLSRLEQDIMAKQNARGPAAFSPGVVPSNRGGLDQLEQDILAKQWEPNNHAASAGSSSTTGAPPSSLTQMEQDLMVKQSARNLSQARSNLNTLEEDMRAKRVAGASALTQMEGDLRSKMSHGMASTVRLQPNGPADRMTHSTTNSELAARLSHAVAPQNDRDLLHNSLGAGSTSGDGGSHHHRQSGSRPQERIAPPPPANECPPPHSSYESSPDYSMEQAQNCSRGMDGGIEAFVADNVVEATGVAVIMSEEEEEKLDTIRRKRLLIKGGISLSILIIAIVVTVALWAGRDNSAAPLTAMPTEAPSAVPSAAPSSDTLQTILECLSAHGITGPEELGDKFSSQYRAAFWLAEEDAFWPTEGLDCQSARFQQRFALATWYYVMDGDDWSICSQSSISCPDGDNFLSNTDHCAWHLMACNQEGLVTTFDWSGSTTKADRFLTPLTGSLPLELQYLSTMQRFSMFDYDITGSIDGPFRTWTNVTALILGNNQLTGSIHSSIVIDCPNLQDLRLQENNLRGTLPEGLADLQLVELSLNDNNFAGSLPPNLGTNAQSLVNVYLQNTNIEGPIPSTLWGLPNLRRLRLEGNPGLTGVIGTQIGLMRNLAEIGLSNTQVGGLIPDGFYSVPLRDFEANNCGFQGALSPSVANFNATLHHFQVANNELTGRLPGDEFAVCTSLEKLELQGNSFTGSIPEALCLERGCSGNGCIAILDVDCSVDCNCCELRPDCPEKNPRSLL